MKHQKLGGGTNHDLAGINIQQRLTGNKGVRLHDYYGRAICKHAGDVGAMNNTIWTFLQLDNCLKCIHVPIESINCNIMLCNESVHINCIAKFHDDIV